MLRYWMLIKILPLTWAWTPAEFPFDTIVEIWVVVSVVVLPPVVAAIVSGTNDEAHILFLVIWNPGEQRSHVPNDEQL